MRGGGARGVGVLGALWLLLQAPACASDLRLEDGRFHYADRGVSLRDPRALAPEAAWRRAELEGAKLAFRAPEGTAAAWVVSCRDPERGEAAPSADARTLSRHLLFALEERRVEEEGPVSVEGAEVYRRVVRARAEGAPVRLETVTRVEGPCTYDWLLVTRGAPGPDGETFERWWRSFRPGGGAAATPAPERRAEPAG